MAKKRAPVAKRSGKGRKRPASSRKKPSLGQSLAANADTIALVLVASSGLLILDITARPADDPGYLRQLAGWGALPIVISILLVSLGALIRHSSERLGVGLNLPWGPLFAVLAGLELVLLALLGLTHLFADAPDALALALAGQGGGLLGWVLGSLTSTLLGDLIATIVLVALAGLGLWVAARPIGLPALHWRQVWASLRESYQRLLPDEPAGAPAVDAPGAALSPAVTSGSKKKLPSSPEAADTHLQPRPKRKRPARSTPKPRPIKPKPRPDYLPPLDLLSGEASATVEEADIQYKAQVIEHTLRSFSVPVQVVDINVGPAVTQFGVKPGYLTRRGPDGQPVRRRVRVSRIKSLANDLALALEASSLRIEAPVPGKGYVGIEVPNSDTHLVTLRAVMESQAFLRQIARSPLAFALGRDVSGQPVAADLAAMPHLLIAGATGSGKSVCINAIIASLLFNNGPDRVRLLLVDPKRVELPIYNGVAHLVSPVVTDVDQVVGALTWLTLQMDDRYRAFARIGARNLADYNRKVRRKRKPAAWRDLEPFPYLVLFIDELADLMMAAPDDVERHVCRLAQMARATGIHLVIATQRPSVDVVTGLIKANFPARIAFAVTSQMDSRVVLDTPGADKLLGRGDMLFMRPDSSKLARVQGCFVSDSEISALVRFWKETMPVEELPPEVPRYPWTGLMAQLEDQDDLYDRALDLIQGQERVSASWLQRRMRIGYNRAAGLIGRMEADGYVGPDEGAGRGREVLLADDEEGDELF